MDTGSVFVIGGGITGWCKDSLFVLDVLLNRDLFVWGDVKPGDGGGCFLGLGGGLYSSIWWWTGFSCAVSEASFSVEP